MLNFLANQLLRSLSPLCHYSQGFVQILVMHAAFLLPVEPHSPILLAYPHSLVSVPNTKNYILPGTSSSHTWQHVRNISYQANPSYNTLLRTRDGNRNQWMQHLRNKDKARYHHLEVQPSQYQMFTHQPKNTIRNHQGSMSSLAPSKPTTLDPEKCNTTESQGKDYKQLLLKCLNSLKRK